MQCKIFSFLLYISVVMKQVLIFLKPWLVQEFVAMGIKLKLEDKRHCEPRSYSDFLKLTFIQQLMAEEHSRGSTLIV